MLRTSIAFAWAAALALVAGTAVPADQPAPSQTGTVTVYKVNALLGTAFRTAAGEKVGTLKDIVIDPDGRIVYGVLSHGGVAGVGDKLFAVPPAVLQTLGPAAGNADRKAFTLQVDKATLDNTAGFNEKNYPTAPGPIFTTAGQGAKAAGDHANSPAAAAGEAKLFRLKSLEGTAVRSRAGADLGTVRDWVVSLNEPKVHYAIFSSGGTLRVGAKYFACPWKAMELKSLTGNPAQVAFVVDVSKQTLEGNAGFNPNGFPTEQDLKLFSKGGTEGHDAKK